MFVAIMNSTMPVHGMHDAVAVIPVPTDHISVLPKMTNLNLKNVKLMIVGIVRQEELCCTLLGLCCVHLQTTSNVQQYRD